MLNQPEAHANDGDSASDSVAVQTLLEVRGLQVELATPRGAVAAVRALGFTLARGGTLGLVGESGCGKSMTALALMGLQPEGARVTGSIRLGGEELAGAPERRWQQLRGARVAMVFQEPMTALNPVKTIGEQVAEPLLLHRRCGRREALERAAALLERVGIAPSRTRLAAYPHQFSGGQRQRIMLAMALACGPDLLIADEPTTALDVTVQRQIVELIGELVRERGMALLLISHDLGLVAENAEQVLVMYGGTAVESGPTRAVFERLAHPYTQGLLAARPRLPRTAGERRDAARRLATIPGSVPELHALPAGCPFAGRCPLGDAACAAPPLPPLRLVPAADGGAPAAADHWARCLKLEQSLAAAGAGGLGAADPSAAGTVA
jgi:peptide/nickel transport system ATP-binding protein